MRGLGNEKWEPKRSPRCRYCFGGVVVAGFAAGFVPVVAGVLGAGLAGAVPAAGAATPDCVL